MPRHRILIVDDETTIREVVRKRLAYADFDVIEASGGLEALEVLSLDEIHLVVLDIAMPDMDGLEVLRQLRRTSLTPVLMLTARGDLTDRIAAMELGADDYMVKPFSPRELERRIRCVLRIEEDRLPEPDPRVSGLDLDAAAHRVRVGSTEVELTEMEYQLLALLASHPGRMFTRSEILHRVWGYRISHFTDGRVVDVHVARLKAKLEPDPSLPELVMDVRGTGYLCQSRDSMVGAPEAV